MNTLLPGITGRRSGTKKKNKKKEDRSGRKQKVCTKRKASAMATVEELAAALGIGRNQAYELVTGKKGDPRKGTKDEPPKVPAMRFGRRYLIPRAVIAKIVSGEAIPSVATAQQQRAQTDVGL